MRVYALQLEDPGSGLRSSPQIQTRVVACVPTPRRNRRHTFPETKKLEAPMARLVTANFLIATASRLGPGRTIYRCLYLPPDPSWECPFL